LLEPLAIAEEIHEPAQRCPRVEFGRRCKEPGWLEAEPQLLLLPDPVRRAVLDWTTGGRSATD